MALSLLETEYRRVLQEQAKYTSSEPVNLSARVEVVGRPDLGFTVGGWLDPRTRRYMSAAAEPAVVWTVGEQQFAPLRFVEHDEDCRPKERLSRFVLVGGKGAGKTEVGVRALALLQMYYSNSSLGLVAPTAGKVGIARAKLRAILPPSWVLEDCENPRMEPPFMLLANGNKIQFLSATEPSKKKGTQIHGWDWIGALIEEEQQCSLGAVTDVDTRGRAAIDGWYPVLSTCTISDDAEWRMRLERYEKQPTTVVYEMSFLDNPFNSPEFVERMKERLTERDLEQQVFARKMRPERATYPQYDTALHVRPIPIRGDMTRSVVGADFLIGHDPGENFDVSLLLKCYDIEGERVWFVLDELTTERTTSEQHASQLADWLQGRYNAHKLTRDRNGNLVLDALSPQVLIRADPHATSAGKPDVTVYRYFQQYLFKITSATYKKTRNPALAANPGSLQVDARIQMVNVLLKNAAQRTRLYLAADENGLPRAARLANALAMSKRDEYFKAEQQRKDIHDLSHWPSALGFALWHYEHARIGWPAQ